MVESFTEFGNEICWLLCSLMVGSAYGHEAMNGHDSDRRTEPMHRDYLLSVSHSQQRWQAFAGRRLVEPFCAIGEEGS